MSASPESKCSVNAFSTPHNTVIEDINHISNTGWGGISLHTSKSNGISDKQIRDKLREEAIDCVTVMPDLVTILPAPISEGATDPEKRAELICEEIPTIASFEPEAMMVGPGASNDPENPQTDLDGLRDGLTWIAERASEYDLRVSLELLAERVGSPLATLPDMVEFIDDIPHSNIGITFDVWHSWPEPHLHHHIREYIDYIDHVHVCDVSWTEQSQYDREFPGDGRRLAVPIMATLIEAGYDGWWELETFSDDGSRMTHHPHSLWEVPHEEFLSSAMTAYSHAYNEARNIADVRCRDG